MIITLPLLILCRKWKELNRRVHSVLVWFRKQKNSLLKPLIALFLAVMIKVKAIMLIFIELTVLDILLTLFNPHCNLWGTHIILSPLYKLGNWCLQRMWLAQRIREGGKWKWFGIGIIKINMCSSEVQLDSKLPEVKT